MTRRLAIALAATGVAALVSGAASDTIAKRPATAPDAQPQRIAIELKLPLDSDTGTFVLEPLSAGRLTADSGTFRFTSGPTPVFLGRVINGQSVDRFRATDTLDGANGSPVIELQIDFVSAGHGYQIGSGAWSIASGTGAYAGITGRDRSALVRPPVPPGEFGVARHEGFVTARG
jgi:hypothetical protein